MSYLSCLLQPLHNDPHIVYAELTESEGVVSYRLVFFCPYSHTQERCRLAIIQARVVDMHPTSVGPEHFKTNIALSVWTASPEMR